MIVTNNYSKWDFRLSNPDILCSDKKKTLIDCNGSSTPSNTSSQPRVRKTTLFNPRLVALSYVCRCYAMIGDFKKASYYCALSSESVEKTFGSSSVEYAHELHKLSQLLFNDRQFKKALSTIDKASSLLMRHYGRNNPDVEELNEMKCCLMSFGARSRISKS